MRQKRLTSKAVTLSLTLAVAAAAQSLDWPQWGGPNRDFKAPSQGLATSWPASGPKELWSRPLGEGYSAIAAEGGVLYTQYRPLTGSASPAVAKFAGSNPEVVAALDAASGRTLWEHVYEAPVPPGMNVEYGPGPHATPLVAGGLVFAAGSTGKLHALDKRTGRAAWAKDLWRDMRGQVLERGYSASPLAHGENVVVTVGGAGQALAAFRQRDGQLAWKSHDFELSPSSPMLIRVDGQEQLVLFHAQGVAGVDPSGGPVLWNHTHRTRYGLNISPPVWGDGNLLFISSAYDGGSRCLRLRQAGGRTTVEELWASSRMRVHFGDAIRIGDVVYGSSGDFGPAPFTAVEVATGKVLWQDRALGRSSFVAADGKLVLLDEDGGLALATVSPLRLTVLAKAQVFHGRSWTVPTLVGTRLYLRDRATIKALELGQPG
jgi:outer membrane protein assembly factor BamB